jgi:hypothetical protein
MYWFSENPNIYVDKTVNLPGLTVWCGVSYRGIVGLYFFTGAEYLNMSEASIVPTTHQLYGGEEIYYQQDRAPPHYHHDISMTTSQTGR